MYWLPAVETRELYAMITRAFGSSVSTPAATERLSPEMSISVVQSARFVTRSAIISQ